MSVRKRRRLPGMRVAWPFPIEPALDPAPEETDVRRLIIEAGDMFKGGSASSKEIGTTLLGDLFQRFKAIGHECRGHDQHPPFPLSREPLQLMVGVGHEPGFSDEA